jgi:hypothetical protein
MPLSRALTLLCLTWLGTGCVYRDVLGDPPEAVGPCDATTCLDGCCSQGQCLRGGAMSALACGSNGAVCQRCPGGSQASCRNGACSTQTGCDSSSCPAGTQCQNGTCTPVTSSCGPCAGCCTSNGFCQGGDSDLSCGKGGAPCRQCANSEVCKDQACIQCSPDNCTGCCDSFGECVSGLSDEFDCGRGGETCNFCGVSQSCLSGVCQ